MALRNLLGPALLAVLLVAACGGRSPLSVPDCNAAAVSFCQTDGCPFTGPAASTDAALTAWCSAVGAFSARVTGYGTCLTPAGEPWALDVQATDTRGNQLYVLYDLTSGELLSASTIALGDGGIEQDYGTCGESVGIVRCSHPLYTCDR
jgi:hypothetical protein